MKSSGVLPRSNFSPIREAGVVCAGLCLLVTASLWWFYSHGYILYYGDAQAHLNISRSIIDSRTPGYRQLGTVWLPVLHVLGLPFVWSTRLWSSGLAGSIPVAICFVTAGIFFYMAAREAYDCVWAATVTVLCFALNPNVLYLGSIPMTELVFLAGLGALLFALFRYRKTQRARFIALGVFASWWMSLTRYDGWFLIPFIALCFTAFSKNKRWIVFVAAGLFAGFAPLYWFAHNWWETANPLDFYNGPYSAIAIQGAKSYPGFHDWTKAVQYYSKAGELCTGWGLAFTGVVGFVCALLKKSLTAILFLLLTPCFYIWSIHSSGTPIFVPQLWPFTYYNTRYGIAVVVLAAFCAGAIVLALPRKWKSWSLMLPVLCVLPWIIHPSRENWICWKESQINSIARRYWIEGAADFMRAHYKNGEGILAPFGDITGIFCRGQIRLAQTLHEGNGPSFIGTKLRSDLLHQEVWAVTLPANYFSASLPPGRSSAYRVVKEIRFQGAPVLEIYKRSLP